MAAVIHSEKCTLEKGLICQIFCYISYFKIQLKTYFGEGRILVRFEVVVSHCQEHCVHLRMIRTMSFPKAVVTFFLRVYGLAKIN